jgi:TonB family protein
MDVVLPEWILSLDEPLRAIVLRHEEEHRSARDPYLLFGAALAVALMPWNVALWFQARRLRLAIELDCDARVLRTHPSTERYGLLMLTIAQRRSVAPTLFAPMLSEPTTQLERRIIAMRTTTRRLARVTVYGGSVVAVGVLAFACSLQSDNVTGPKPSRLPQRVTDNQTFFEFQVEKEASPVPDNPAPRYTDLLRSANVEGEVLAQFVVDTMGRVDASGIKVLRSTHDLFTNAVKASLPNMKFTPAEVGHRKVKQLVQMPFQFSLTKGSVLGPAIRPNPGRPSSAEASACLRRSSHPACTSNPRCSGPSLRSREIEGHAIPTCFGPPTSKERCWRNSSSMRTGPSIRRASASCVRRTICSRTRFSDRSARFASLRQS